MSEQNSSRWKPILLVGCLSMFIAEVFAGSSRIWLIDPWSLIVTFPLYLGHLLFFLNIAMRTKRTSIPQLYLFGVLFALYESWITKVLWFGYPGSEGAMFGLVGGIAIGEFIILVFFWHPIMAFLLPILIFQSLAISKETERANPDIIFYSHSKYLKKYSLLVKIFVIMAICGSALLSFNSGSDLLTALIAGLSSAALIYIIFRTGNRFSIHDLKLGRKGFTIITIYLILLYAITIPLILPERIPTSMIPIIIIIAIYILVGILIKISKPIDENRITPQENRDAYIKSSSVFKLFLIFSFLTVFYCIVPIISIGVALIFTLSVLVVGPIIFIFFTWKAIKGEELIAR